MSQRSDRLEDFFPRISIYLFQLFIILSTRLLTLRLADKTIHSKGLSLDSKKTYVLAANHQRGHDPFVLITLVPRHIRQRLLPIKFITKNRYYHTWWQPISFLCGCFPASSRHDGDSGYGVDEAVRVGKLGYSVMIFPEGRVTSSPGEERAHSGISRILKELPEAELILCKIVWHKNDKGRYAVDVYYKNAGKDIDRQNPQQILDAIYSL